MYSTDLTSGRYFPPGNWFKSPNGQFKLIYQTDGNFVLYGPGNRATWNSATWGRSAGRAIMQADGNLVVYDAGNRAVWNSQTWGNPGARLALQDDGNLVVYSTTGRALWNSGTWGGRTTIPQSSNPPANVAQSLLGRWHSQHYRTTVDVTVFQGKIKISWNIGGEGLLWQDGNTLWMQWPFTGAPQGKALTAANSVSRNQVVWNLPGGAWEDTWTRVS